MNIDNLQTITICPVSALFPHDWYDWIFDAISQDAPFSFGDTKHTLVAPEEFRNWLEKVFDFHDFHMELIAVIAEQRENIFDQLKKLDDLGVWVDLEN